MLKPPHSKPIFGSISLSTLDGFHSQSATQTASSSSALSASERMLGKILSGTSETQRGLLTERLLKALELPKASVEQHPQLKEIHRLIHDFKGAKEAEIPSEVPVLSTDQIASLSNELRCVLARPILNRENQAFIRVLKQNVATHAELKKVQTLGPRHVSPMTLVGNQAPFQVYDHGAWKNRSGLLFNKSTSHVGGKKRNFGSDVLADSLSNNAQQRAYSDSFADNPAGDTEKLYPVLNSIFNNTLAPLAHLTQKYVEMDQRRTGEIPDRSNKHEIVDFLRAHCGFNDETIQPFEAYQAAFDQALKNEPDPKKIQRLRQAAQKLLGQDKSSQIRYLGRGITPPQNEKYRGLAAFAHNEHLCLPQTGDVEGVYANLTSLGMAHAVSIHDELVAGSFESDQQRIYAYQPSTGLNLVSREEIESLQGVVQAIESKKTREQTLALIDTHRGTFTDSDSLTRLQSALIKTESKDEALFQSCFDPSVMSNELKRSFLGDACVRKNYPLARALFDNLPPETQASVMKDRTALVALIAAFSKDPKGLSDLKGLIDQHQIDLCQQNTKQMGYVLLATRHRHIDALPVLKAWGVDVNQKDNQGQTAALWAAFKGDAEVIKALSDCGADLNLCSKNGSTPAHAAAEQGQASVIKLLADCGADLNLATELGITAAHVAAEHGRANVIQQLAHCGADLNLAAEGSLTPAHIAARLDRANVIRQLAHSGANLNLQDERGNSPIFIAAAQGNSASLKALAECGANPHHMTKSGATLALVAAEEVKAEVIKLLFDGRDLSSIEQPDSEGWTFAHHAAGQGNIEALKALADCGVNLNKRNTRNGLTPAHKAAESGKAHAIKQLSDSGADLNAISYQGYTPMHFAAGWGNLEALEALADCRANLNKLTNGGFDAAHIAIRNGKAEVIQLLAEQQVDLKSTTKGPVFMNMGGMEVNRSSTPLSYARHLGKTDALDALYRYAGIFDSRDHAQKSIEKKLVLCIRALTRQANQQTPINSVIDSVLDSIPGLRGLINDPVNKQRIHDRLLASDTFSYKKRSTGYLLAESAQLTPDIRRALLSALGNTGITSSLHQERLKLDDWCAASDQHPTHRHSALHKVEHYIQTRSLDVQANPAQTAPTLKSFSTDMRQIDLWLDRIARSSNQPLEAKKYELKRQLLQAHHNATQNNPLLAAALKRAYEELPLQGIENLWQQVTAVPSPPPPVASP